MQIQDENKQEEITKINQPAINDKKEQECLIFDDFTNLWANNWLMVNDGVMWGKSIWDYQIENGTFTLSGFINTNGWWFSSVRAWLKPWILSEYNNIKITAKPDNRGYQITFRDNNRRWISHRAILPFQNTWDFEEITININDLEPVFFWRRVEADDFKKDLAREIGFILNDGKDGDFQLEVDSIKFCK